MRGQEEVRVAAIQLLTEEYQRRLQDSAKRLPVNCRHNYRHLLDVRKLVRGDRNPKYNRLSETDQTLGLCMLPKDGDLSGEVLEGWGRTVGYYQSPPPEDAWNGDICEDPVDAQRCPYFSQKRGRDDVLLELRRDLDDSEWVERNMPQLSTLFWVLDQPVKLPWYQRLRLFFVGRKREPLRALPPVDSLFPNE